MTLLESQNHVTAGCEQRRVSFTEQHHGVTSSYLGREGLRSLMPCLDAGFCILHHWEHQRESALVLTDPGLRNLSGHALGPIANSRKSDNLGLFDCGHRREGHQFRITRTNSNKSEAGGHSRIKDGQRSALSKIRSMSRLSIFPEPGERVGEETPLLRRICSEPNPIQRELKAHGVDFEQWPTCRQNADRNLAGTRAPLSTGTYSVGPVEALGSQNPAELGPVWIGLEPRFLTGRGHLGVYLYPGAKRNANSGTLGCVGLIRSEDILMLANLIKQRRVRKLEVME